MRDIGVLLEELRNGDWWQRKKYVAELLAYPRESYAPVLEEWLRNGSDALLRSVAVEAFSALGHSAHASLQRLLADEDADVRVLAAGLLGETRDCGALDSLVDRLGDPAVNVRVAAAEALGKIGDEKAIDALAESLNGSSWETMAAIAALGEIGGERALGVLYQCLEWEDYRDMACAAIEKAGTMDSLSRLERFVYNDRLKGTALKAMVCIAESKGAPLSREYLADMIPLLLELQEASHDEIRKASLIALCWSEDERALPYLLRSLDDSDLQEYSVHGLLALGPPALGGLLESLKKPSGNRGVLAKLVSLAGGTADLLAFAADPDPEVRAEVALAAAKLRTPDVGETLHALVQDPADEVKAAAEYSMKEIGKDGNRG